MLMSLKLKLGVSQPNGPPNSEYDDVSPERYPKGPKEMWEGCIAARGDDRSIFAGRTRDCEDLKIRSQLKFLREHAIGTLSSRFSVPEKQI